MSFDRKSVTDRQIRENENDNFYFTEKSFALSSLSNLTENSEKFHKFVKLKMTTFISRKKLLFCHFTENPEKLDKFVKLKMTTFVSRNFFVLSLHKKSEKFGKFMNLKMTTLCHGKK